MSFAFDGSVVDIATVSSGVLCIFVRPAKRWFWNHSPCFTSRDCINDFLNGVTLIPFLLLIGAVASNDVLQEALKSNRAAMGIAGVIGTIYILREVIFFPLNRVSAEPTAGASTPVVGVSTQQTDPA